MSSTSVSHVPRSVTGQSRSGSRIPGLGQTLGWVPGAIGDLNFGSPVAPGTRLLGLWWHRGPELWVSGGTRDQNYGSLVAPGTQNYGSPVAPETHSRALNPD